jgi:hypothetical protein
MLGDGRDRDKPDSGEGTPHTGRRLPALAIRVAPGSAELPGDLAGRFLVLVRGAQPPEPAMSGLAAARGALADLGAEHLSEVVLSPAGPLLRVGSLDADEDLMQTVPDLVRASLEDAGVDDAEVVLLDPAGPLDALDRTLNAVVLRLFPPPAGAEGQIPPAWLEVATEWVLGDATAEEPIAVRLLGASFEVTGRDAATTLYSAVASRAWCDLVQGDLGRRIRTASLTFGHAPHLTLAAGGPGCDSSQLRARFELLAEVARDVPAAYACLDLEESFADIGIGLAGDGWPAEGGASPNTVAGQAVDLVVPDAFPLQILGPGHLARLRERGHDLDGVALDDGRLEVALGDPDDWSPRFATRADALERATEQLADLLVTDAELAELVRDRPAAAADEVAGAAGGSAGGPDLAAISLDALPHPRRGLRLTLLELAAWIGHEPHSDVPRSVSPVLSAYARWLASGLDHAARQELKPYAARLVGTRGTGPSSGPWRPLSTQEEARAWLAVDALAREQAVAWLRAAGCHGSADALDRVRRMADGRHRARQRKLLDSALAELSTIGAIHGADPSAEEVWDAWEQAAEAGAWVAASEAAWVGIPDAIASATELRARELSRRLAERGAASVAGSPADSVRAAGLAAAAEEAWRLAGEAASARVDEHTGDATSPEQLTAVPLRTAWDRALQGAVGRTGLDRDAVDQAVEDAESRARAVLADLIDGGDPPANAYEVALRAAAASTGGPVWRTVRELAQGVIGEETWIAAHAAGMDALARVVRPAPALVERATLVALAREVGSLAARTAAARGGPAALDHALESLRPAAIAVLDAMLEVRR